MGTIWCALHHGYLVCTPPWVLSGVHSTMGTIWCTLHHGYLVCTPPWVSGVHSTLHHGYLVCTPPWVSVVHSTMGIWCALHHGYLLYTPPWVSGVYSTMGIWCALHHGYLVYTPPWVSDVHSTMGIWCCTNMVDHVLMCGTDVWSTLVQTQVRHSCGWITGLGKWLQKVGTKVLKFQNCLFDLSPQQQDRLITLDDQNG